MRTNDSLKTMVKLVKTVVIRKNFNFFLQALWQQLYAKYTFYTFY